MLESAALKLESAGWRVGMGLYCGFVPGFLSTVNSSNNKANALYC